MRVGEWLATVLGLVAMLAVTALVLEWDVAPIGVWLLLAAAVAAGAYRWGRWRAVLWLGVVPWAGPALLADALWLSGIWDRSSEYEPLPLSMFVLPLVVPTLSGAAAVGVGLRRRSRARPSWYG